MLAWAEMVYFILEKGADQVFVFSGKVVPLRQEVKQVCMNYLVLRIRM